MTQLARAALVAFMLAAPPAFAQLLGSAANFAVLGATPNVTNTGPTVVSGNVGVWPALSITGFPPGLVVPGTGFLHFGDTVAQQAQADNTTAYLALAGLGGATPIVVGLGGQVLGRGVYSTGAADLTGILTLDGAVGSGPFVFQVTALTTASGPGASAVNLINGATPCDVWWQVGSSASIGTSSAMVGNILALTSITIATGASLQGRALARNGTVTLDSNAVNACAGGTAGFIVGPPIAVPIRGAAAPTLSQWVLILLAAMMAFAGLAALHRRSR